MKKSWQDRLAEESGLAVVIADEDSPELTKSNNNSMCEMLYASAEFAPRCAEFCGRAFARASGAGETVAYQCHAGLHCLAVPFKSGEKQLTAIVGRAFLKAENYRQATERAISGDWKTFPPTGFFENVLLTGSANNLEKVAGRIEKLRGEQTDLPDGPAQKAPASEKNGDRETAPDEKDAASTVKETAPEEETAPKENEVSSEEIGKLIENFQQTTAAAEPAARRSSAETEELTAWRTLFGSLLSLDYREACASVLRFVANRYDLSGSAWLKQAGSRLETVAADGELENQPLQINMAADDRRLLEAAGREAAIELRESSGASGGATQRIWLYPVTVGAEVRSALVAAGRISEENRRHIGRFLQGVAAELEILRLREELSRRVWFEGAVHKFNDNLQNIDAEDFWSRLVGFSAELIQAERGSLLLFDDKSKTLAVKAATGTRADIIKSEAGEVGERVARKVLRNGRPLIVQDIHAIALPPAPPEWNYKTNSFISYPIRLGERRIGVLNFADKAGGEIYDEIDLELLGALMPQIAVAIDRAALKDKAGAFEQLSVTDALTGLLNRRYLEERLTEEIKRSNRYGYPMSFMMIDVDYFKAYNDTFSHPEGDKALKLVAQCLKETLRGADVAARYGGEEFSILLPQTNSDEAVIIAERVRHKVETTEFPNRQVTVSIGIASSSLALNTTADLVSAADKALYEAKRQGRNNVQVYENLRND